MRCGFPAQLESCGKADRGLASNTWGWRARFAVAAVLISLRSSAATAGALTNGPVVFDGCGALAQGGAYSNLAVAIQAGAVGTARGGALFHSAGFLHVFQLNAGPALNPRGMLNELDPDNDGDGLYDEDELTGAAFNPATPTDPNNPDSDDDGLSDWAESLAGTDPTNSAIRLIITGISHPDGTHTELRWLGRAGKTYEVLRNDGALAAGPFAAKGTTTDAGPGAGSWHVVTNQWTDDAASSNALFYTIRALP